MVLKNKVSLVSLHQWTIGPLMINIKNLYSYRLYSYSYRI
nr:MAG TPA: hypothetical protein [Caudoviricetes sp.]